MKYPWKNLVFEGGGVKGLAYSGALKILSLHKILDQLQRVAGSSVGSMAATLVSLGYSPDEIKEIFSTLKESDLIETDYFLNKAINLTKEFGIQDGSKLVNLFSRLISEKTGIAFKTFRGLKDLGIGPDLYIIASNIGTKRSEVFSYEHTPDIPIVDAIRASMAVPFFFKPKEIKRKMYLDGGMLLNYPVELFDDAKYVSNASCQLDTAYYANRNKLMNTCRVYNKETLGFRLDSSDQIAEFTCATEGSIGEKPRNIFSFTRSVFETLLDAEENRHLHSDNWQRTIYINTLGVRTMNFNLSEKEKKGLVRSGEVNTAKYLSWWSDISKKNKPVNQLEENNETIWSKLKYFKKTENWGDWKKMDPVLLVRLDAFREFLGTPIFITRGVQGTSDAKKSQHKVGTAVDIIVPNYQGHITDLYNLACSFGFTGAGVYPHWTYKGKKTGGLHLDMRKLPRNTKAARWLCIKKEGKQEYLAYNHTNLKKYKVI